MKVCGTQVYSLSWKSKIAFFFLLQNQNVYLTTPLPCLICISFIFKLAYRCVIDCFELVQPQLNFRLRLLFSFSKFVVFLFFLFAKFLSAVFCVHSLTHTQTQKKRQQLTDFKGFFNRRQSGFFSCFA